jgi:UDP-N-acetylglucosamine 2-epimerase (non-hydrolysing)
MLLPTASWLEFPQNLTNPKPLGGTCMPPTNEPHRYCRNMRVVCVAAARPNFIKIKPIADALTRRDVEVVLVHTGQHYDERMSAIFFSDIGLSPPQHDLGIGSGSHAEQVGRVMIAFERVALEETPDVVVVVGDVNSTLACALAATKANFPVAHVEAGLRSGDWTMPEEVNRIVTDRVSRFLFAPSPDAVDNLRVEGYRDEQIHLVGNVMIDTLLANLDRARRQPILRDLGLQASAYGLVTLHRPSNVDDASTLWRLVEALGEISREVPLVFPVHPRTNARLRGGEVPSGIQLIDPLGYLDFVALESGARLVLTDSGGIQEETTVLGVPCLTLRENTERPITVTEGTNVVVGLDPDRIIKTARTVIRDGVEQRSPALWDGHAGERIAAVLTGVT